MPDNEPRFTPDQRCGHCDQFVPMEIVATHFPVTNLDNPPQVGRLYYELLSCPVCNEVTLRSGVSPSSLSDPTENESETLYPTSTKHEGEAEHRGRFQTSYYTRWSLTPEERAIMFRRLAIIHDCNVKSRKSRLSYS